MLLTRIMVLALMTVFGSHIIIEKPLAVEIAMFPITGFQRLKSNGLSNVKSGQYLICLQRLSYFFILRLQIGVTLTILLYLCRLLEGQDCP